MNDKEILYQMIKRNIDNILGQYVPSLKIFSNTISNYTINFLDPYISAFMEPGTNEFNAEAAGEYLKDETTKKIESFMLKYKHIKDDNV